MAYTDKAYFLENIKETELNELLKDKTGMVKDEYLTAKIKVADDEINSYLRSRVKTLPIPEANVPDKIKQCSYDITMYYLHDRIQYQDVPERVKLKYDDAVRWLERIAKGTVDLGLMGAEDTNTDVDYTANESIFNRNVF